MGNLNQCNLREYEPEQVNNIQLLSAVKELSSKIDSTGQTSQVEYLLERIKVLEHDHREKDEYVSALQAEYQLQTEQLETTKQTIDELRASTMEPYNENNQEEDEEIEQEEVDMQQEMQMDQNNEEQIVEVNEEEEEEVVEDMDE